MQELRCTRHGVESSMLLIVFRHLEILHHSEHTTLLQDTCDKFLLLSNACFPLAGRDEKGCDGVVGRGTSHSKVDGNRSEVIGGEIMDGATVLS